MGGFRNRASPNELLRTVRCVDRASVYNIFEMQPNWCTQMASFQIELPRTRYRTVQYNYMQWLAVRQEGRTVTVPLSAMMPHSEQSLSTAMQRQAIIVCSLM